jgi:di/tricarboxylate transporter
MWWGLEGSGWWTLLVMVGALVLLVLEVWGPDLVLFAAVTLLWVTGVISTEEATSGFSNPQVLTVGLLFIVAAAVRETGALRVVTRLFLSGAGSGAGAMARLLFPTAFVSAFLNNTPIVAMLAPMVRDWAASRGLAPSRFLIPISYATILGGVCTLIGTSTNLLVSGLLEDAKMAPFGMFELTPVGLPVALVGLIFMVGGGTRLLPDRRPPDDPRGERGREFSVRIKVEPHSALVGRDVEAAGLRHLEGLFLVEIQRGEQSLAPAKPSDVLEAGDVLGFVGVPSTVVQVLRTPGLLLVTDDGQETHPERAGRVIHEIVIPEQSDLVGQNLRELQFRRRYDAAVLAIHRHGQRLLQKLGDVELRAGDTLLVEATKGFKDTWAGSPDFLILETPTHAPRPAQSWLALGVMVLVVGLMASNRVPPVLAASVGAVLLVLGRCLPLGKARSSVDLSVVVLLACSFGLSNAIENSGLAAAFAGLVERGLGGFGPLAAVAAIYLLAVGLTELLSNAAAAALVFPVALATAHRLGLDPRPFVVAVTIAASMSFITPIGYQTNLMVYGPGGYRFSDFARVGVPLSILCFAAAMLSLAWTYNL